MSSTIKRGDRVKVTLEGQVISAPIIRHGSENVEVRVQSGGWANFVYVDLADVEKIEPPVEVFGPGTIVRHKKYGSVWAIGDGGYLRLDGAYGPKISDSVFGSDKYELHEFKVG